MSVTQVRVIPAHSATALFPCGWHTSFAQSPFYTVFAADTFKEVIAAYIRDFPRDRLQPLIIQEQGLMTTIASLDIPELRSVYERIFRKVAFSHPPLLERLGHINWASRRFAPQPRHTLAHRDPADARHHAQALTFLGRLRARNGNDTSFAARRLHTIIPRFSMGAPEAYDLGARMLYMIGQGEDSGVDMPMALKLFERTVRRYEESSCAVLFQAFQRSLIEPIERELPACIHGDYNVRDPECVITYQDARHQAKAFAVLASKFGNDPYGLYDIASTIEPWTIDYFFHREYGERFFVRPNALRIFMALAPRLRSDIMRKKLFDRQIRRFVTFERFASPLARRHHLDTVRDAASTLMILNREYFTGPHGTVTRGRPLPASAEVSQHRHPKHPRHWLHSGILDASKVNEAGSASMHSAVSFFLHSITTA